MDYYLRQSLSKAPRDTQTMFVWPELWLMFRWERWSCWGAFEDAQIMRGEGSPEPGVFDVCYWLDRGQCDRFMFNGWQVRWMDWASMPNTDAEIGKWCAYHTGDLMLYSAYPGRKGMCLRGQMIDISLQPGQEIINFTTPTTVKNRARKQCLYGLLEEIAEVRRR